MNITWPDWLNCFNGNYLNPNKATHKKTKQCWLISKQNIKNFEDDSLHATNSDFLIFISLKPNGVNLWYFKLILFDLTELIVWNIKGLRHWNLKIEGLENQSLLQKLNSFTVLVDEKFLKYLLSTLCCRTSSSQLIFLLA